MSNPSKVKTYSDTFIYSISEEGTNHSISKAIIEFIGKADRINPVDSSFKTVADQVKLKQTTAVLFKIMMRKDVVLCVYNKEMPATMKVFAAKDILYDKKRRVFVDCTGLISMENGYWTCKDIGKLCSYLFAAMINLIYLIDSSKLTSNSSLIKTSTRCFVKMFTGILDNLRTINYEENRSKISYIAGVYYLYNMMGKDINYARATSIAAVKISPRDAQAYDLYYDIDKDLMNIDTLIRDMVHFFNLKGLDTSIYIDRWTFVYGKGTMYGMEYLPAFLDILAYAYVGAYLNNQKSIELICRQDMVSTATTLINIGSDMFNNVSNMDLESALENRREEWADDFGDGILDEVHKMAKISRYKKFEAELSKNKESKDNNNEEQTVDTKNDTEKKAKNKNDMIKKFEASKKKMINRGVKEDVMSDFDNLVPVEEDTDLDSLLDEDF